MSAPPPGSGPELTPTEARGAVRTGRNIWILVISLALAVVLLLGYWLLHAGQMHSVAQSRPPAGASFNETTGSPRTAPPGEPSSTGANSQ